MRFSVVRGIFRIEFSTRFWLFKLLPIVRAGGAHYHLLASFGRVAAEAVFRVPASLMPSENVVWDASSDRARTGVTHGTLIKIVEIEVAADGRPLSVLIQRWSNANPRKVWRSQPFGGTLSDFRELTVTCFRHAWTAATISGRMTISHSSGSGFRKSDLSEPENLARIE